MAEYRLTPKAEQDLRDIWRYIAIDNEAAADALFGKLLDKLQLASEQPMMGVGRPELSQTARILIEGACIIIYEPTTYGVLAVAIVHSMRDASNWLD